MILRQQLITRRPPGAAVAARGRGESGLHGALSSFAGDDKYEGFSYLYEEIDLLTVVAARYAALVSGSALV